MNGAIRLGMIGAALAAVLARPSRAQSDSSITVQGLAGVHLCDSLVTISRLYPTARDTSLRGEDGQTSWPGKVVTSSDGSRLLFEASWIDHRRVWRLSTTSSAYRTRSGLRVGSTVADVARTGQRLRLEFPEGVLVIALRSDSVAFEVDPRSAASFYRRFKGQGDPLRVLDQAAQVHEIFVSGGCAAAGQPPN